MQVLAPVGTFVVVAAVGVTAALVSGGDNTDTPRTLRLAGGSATDSARTAAVAPGESSGSTGYRLVGALPSGTPDDAPAWNLTAGPADTEVVQRLAKALHAGVPVRDGKGWRAGGLTVNGDAGQTWYYSACTEMTPEGPVAPDSTAPDSPVSSGTTVSGCAIATPGIAVDGAPDSGSASGYSGPSGSDGSGTDGNSGSGTATREGDGTTSSSGVATAAPPPAQPQPAPPQSTQPHPAEPPVAPSPAPEPAPVPASTVHKGADPVLTALGLEVADATIETGPYGGSASLDRTVGGLKTVGLTTRIDVDRDGKVQSASGALAEATKADSYPLITAQEAFDALPAEPRTMMACPVTPDGKGCVEPPVQEVTGAELGLLAQPLRDGGQVLVPAWLFEVKGSTFPVAQVAVQAKYLAPDEPDPVASDQPAPKPSQVDPAPPTRTSVSIDAAYRATTPNAVVVQYGESGSCPHENVTHQVKESADVVYVFLQADARKDGIACTEDYHPVKITVELQAPLGDRKVHDGVSGREVPLS